MNKLRLYRIDLNYIKYLYKFDKKVQFNKNREDEYTNLNSQYRFCNKHIAEIESKALETYNKSQKNKFLKKVCCNFKLLEEKLLKYKC